MAPNDDRTTLATWGPYEVVRYGRSSKYYIEHVEGDNTWVINVDGHTVWPNRRGRQEVPVRTAAAFAAGLIWKGAHRGTQTDKAGISAVTWHMGKPGGRTFDATVRRIQRCAAGADR